MNNNWEKLGPGRNILLILIAVFLTGIFLTGCIQQAQPKIDSIEFKGANWKSIYPIDMAAIGAKQDIRPIGTAEVKFENKSNEGKAIELNIYYDSISAVDSLPTTISCEPQSVCSASLIGILLQSESLEISPIRYCVSNSSDCKTFQIPPPEIKLEVAPKKIDLTPKSMPVYPNEPSIKETVYKDEKTLTITNDSDFEVQGIRTSINSTSHNVGIIGFEDELYNLRPKQSTVLKIAYSSYGSTSQNEAGSVTICVGQVDNSVTPYSIICGTPEIAIPIEVQLQ
ncbi:MAG: hypothetical protein HY394_02550 [Candidatus Diapherotrites archaeon]|nr:hypothetical protein [Candidatus Diapherotrites archaeon]